MNRPFEPDEPTPDPLPIEQQLKQFRPRAPRLDIDSLLPATAHANTEQANTTHANPIQATPASIAANSANSTKHGFTIHQLTLAVAASWLVGALVGGMGIYLSMSGNPTAPPLSDATVDNVRTDAPQDKSPQDNAQRRDTQRTNAQRSQARPGSYAANSASTLDLSDWNILNDEPLTVRALPSTRSAKRLTTARSHRDAQQTPEAKRPFDESEEALNRQQLMQQYLNEANRPLH